MIGLIRIIFEFKRVIAMQLTKKTKGGTEWDKFDCLDKNDARQGREQCVNSHTPLMNQ